METPPNPSTHQIETVVLTDSEADRNFLKTSRDLFDKVTIISKNYEDYQTAEQKRIANQNDLVSSLATLKEQHKSLDNRMISLENLIIQYGELTESHETSIENLNTNLNECITDRAAHSSLLASQHIDIENFKKTLESHASDISGLLNSLQLEKESQDEEILLPEILQSYTNILASLTGLKTTVESISNRAIKNSEKILILETSHKIKKLVPETKKQELEALKNEIRHMRFFKWLSGGTLALVLAFCCWIHMHQS